MPSLPDKAAPEPRVRIVGIVRGRDVDADATLGLDEEALVIAWSNAAPWRLDLSALDGVAHRPSHATMYLRNGDVLELAGDDALRPFALSLIDRACTLPEFTRGLRAFGSLRGSPGAAHDKWFAPLLAARRAVAGVSDVSRQVTLMDARKIAQEMVTVLTKLSQEKAPSLPPMQRALEAALAEESASAFAALERVALRGDVLQGSAEDTRLADWRLWVAALRDAFTAVDECWPRCAAVLGESVLGASGTGAHTGA